MSREMVATLVDSTRLKREFFARNKEAINGQAVLLAAALKKGGKLIAFGNGGSAADAARAAELLVRRGFAGIALPAMFNVDGPTFSGLYQALRRPGDCALAISTSGNSLNILQTVETAQAAKDPVIAFTGNSGGRLRGLVPGALVVGDENTKLPVARIQEVHLMLIHELFNVAFSMLDA